MGLFDWSETMSELAKLNNLGNTYGEVGAFLDWILEHPELVLAKWLKVNDRGQPRVEPLLVPAGANPTALLCEYFGLDASALERERRELLADARDHGA